MRPFTGIATLAFFSALLFCGGIILHILPPLHPATGPGKPAAVHGKKKPAFKAAPLKAAPASAENPLAFPLLGAGGGGLLLAALLALGLSRTAPVPAPATRRQLEAEQAARRRQQEEFAEQSAALQTQLSEEKQRKAETEALREQVSRQFQEFFRTLPVPCFCFAANGRIIRWNAACETLYGLPAAAALESTLWETIVPEPHRAEAEAQISRVLAGETLPDAERWDTVAGGELSHLRCSMVPLYDAEGKIIGGLSAGVHIPDMALYEQQIAALTAAHDTISLAPGKPKRPVNGEITAKMLEEFVAHAGTTGTGEPAGAAEPLKHTELSGHPAFRARLAEEAERAARYHGTLSVILLDLDGFTERNRTLGFAAGDEALQTTAAVLKSKLRIVDVIVHLGADEYAVILPETGEAGANIAAERLRSGLSAAGTGSRPPLSACFGVAQLTPDISGPDDLAARALQALQSARSFGAGSVVHYQDLPQGNTAAPAPDAPARRRRPAAKAPKTKAEVSAGPEL